MTHICQIKCNKVDAISTAELNKVYVEILDVTKKHVLYRLFQYFGKVHVLNHVPACGNDIVLKICGNKKLKMALQSIVKDDDENHTPEVPSTLVSLVQEVSDMMVI